MSGSRLGERRPLLTLGLTTGVVALGFAGFVAVGSGDTAASAHTTTTVASPLDKSDKGDECNDDSSKKGDANEKDDDCTVTVTKTKTKTVTVGKGVTTTVTVTVPVTVTVTQTVTSTTTVITGPITTPGV